MAETLLHDYKDQITALILFPSSGGVFEVTVNGKILHSKKSSGEFPETDTLKRAMGDAIAA